MKGVVASGALLMESLMVIEETVVVVSRMTIMTKSGDMSMNMDMAV